MADSLRAIYDIFSSEATYGNGALFAAFLAFAATGEWVAERSGTLNISVEGMLLSGAFSAVMGYHITGSVAVGLLTGILGGMLVAGVQAEMSHRLTADQFVVGLTLNLLVLGLAGFLENEIAPESTLAGKWENPAASRHSPRWTGAVRSALAVLRLVSAHAVFVVAGLSDPLGFGVAGGG